MRVGLCSSLVLLVAAAPALAGCALVDLLRDGSHVEEAFEYLPADTFQVRFAEGGLPDDLDTSEIGRYARVMEDASFNDGDVAWEAWAAWGDPEDGQRTAAVWKVEDDTDLDAFADELEELGYDKDEVDGRVLLSIDVSASEDGTVGGTYPVPLLLNVLIDEDEQVVAGATDAVALEDLGRVIGDDDDSLADDDGFEALLDAAPDDPDIAWLAEDGAAVCAAPGRRPGNQQPDDQDLGRPEGRALFVSGDEEVRLVLQYASDSDAEDDLAAREALIEDGLERITRQPFADLGEFEVERDGDLLLIEEDYEDGAPAALRAERDGGGPGRCGPAA